VDFEHILNELNDSQKQAVANYEGPSLIIAGAGSGKTKVLTVRIAYLIANGVQAWQILALTFTNKAAREMRERIGNLIGNEQARYLNMGTFHSIFAKILRMEADKIGHSSNYTIYDSADSKSLIRKIIKDLRLDPDSYKQGAVLGRISKAKNNLVTAKAYNTNEKLKQFDRETRMPDIYRIYQEYSKRCKQSDAMDFDDLLLNINILFRDNPDVALHYQNKFKYILVDEYQDTNLSQYIIIKKLSELNRNLTVVGDDAQSIYSFRGAKIENILNFRNDYKDYKLFKLERNYRSTKNIVNAANSLIAKNKNQIQKKIYSEKDFGNKIKILRANTDIEEGYNVVSHIFDLSYGENYKYSDFAILYRTNSQSRIFEEALRKRNIPYKLYGGTSFYQRKEIKDLLSYLRVVVNPNDSEAIKRIINYPKRGIGATTIDKLESAAVSQSVSLWNVLLNLHNYGSSFNAGTQKKLIGFVGSIQQYMAELSNLNAYDLAQKIAQESGILKNLFLDKSPEGVSRYENIKELLNGVNEFIETETNVDPDAEIGLPKYLENVALLTDMDAKDDDTPKVSLMTVHASKGLEYKNIFIVGVEQDLFPSQMSSGSEKEIEEERRLFYVAITRAEQNAIISYAMSRRKWGNFNMCNPSRFISEINPEFLDMPSNFNPIPKTANQESIFESFNEKPKGFSNFNKKNTNFGKFKSTKTSSFKSFKSDNAKNITIGMTVEHARFGLGKVIALEAEWPETKAEVDFKTSGKRQLLLKFAKLKIVE